MDKRYTINLEHCGHAEARHVVRFCGEWVGQSETAPGAEAIRDAHANERDAILTGGNATRVVSVPTACVERPGARGQRGEISYGYLIHAAEANASDDLTAVLCRGLKLTSLLHDSSQYNVHAVDCERCLAALKRRGLTIEVQS